MFYNMSCRLLLEERVYMTPRSMDITLTVLHFSIESFNGYDQAKYEIALDWIDLDRRLWKWLFTRCMLFI